MKPLSKAQYADRALELACALNDCRAELAKAKADRDDYEQRWLAECRAHGETRRKLETAEGFLPLARPCGPGGPCPYHRSGGPHTIACGDDRYNGHNPLAP